MLAHVVAVVGGIDDIGVVHQTRSLERGERYTVSSYAPQAQPAELAELEADYPAEVLRYLDLERTTLPTFGSPGRASRVAGLFEDERQRQLWPYEQLSQQAEGVARGARTPYGAVVAIEAWLRSAGGFTYDEQPPRPAGAPPLAYFVSQGKRGYCQHFAGSMALMLRFLGIPARVATGFTSGDYRDGVWNVTDHNAHAWVEVWFPGQGWVSFDPTPGRGTFGGIYSFASDSQEAIEALNRGELGEGGVDPDRLARGADLPTAGAGGEAWRPSPFAIGLGLAALWLGVVGGGKTVRRRVARLTRDPRRAATASRRELEAFLRDQGIAIGPAATLDDLRLTLARELGLDARAFTLAVGRARFGPPDRKGHDASAPRRELERLLRAMRLQLSGWARFRGFASVRSLQRAAQR